MSGTNASELMLDGFIVAEQLVIALYFFRFWRESRDRLFLFLFSGFAVMAVHRALLAMAVMHGISLEQQTPYFWLRVVSYLLIFAGVVDKNRRSR